MSAPEQTGLAGEEQLSAMIIMAKAVTGAGEEDTALLESLCRAELTIWSRGPDRAGIFPAPGGKERAGAG